MGEIQKQKLEEWLGKAIEVSEEEELHRSKKYQNLLNSFKKEQKSEQLLLIC